MIYTSYFGNYKNFPEGIVVSITQYPPRGWNGLELRSLAPSADLLQKFKNKEIDEQIFSWKYLEGLNKDANLRERIKDTLKYLEKTFGNIILCCYEKSEDFCHRHLVAKWLQEIDIKVEEL